MIWTARISALTVAAAFVLVGCSSPSTDAEPAASSPEPPQASTPQASAPQASTSQETASTPEAKAASGTTVDGKGYQFTAPKGWKVPTGDARPPGPDTVMADTTDTDGFADNMNVVLTPPGKITPEQIEEASVKELEEAGATEVTPRERVTVAGSESPHLSGVLTTQGDPYQIEQYYPSHDNQTYVVTFSFSPSVSEADRDALAASVLATWTWA